MNQINIEDLYESLTQLPQNKIDLLQQKLGDYGRKLAADYQAAKQELPTLEKKYFEVKILFKIGAITSIDYAKFEYQLKNARELVAHYVELMNAANTANISLGKLKPPNSPRPNYMKSDVERAREKGPHEPLCDGKDNKMENGGSYSPVPGEGQEE